jgi:hypothetical protein
MKEEPLKSLLERDLHIAYVKEYFSDIIDVMRDMTNYGTNLIMRCFVTGKSELEDAIILGVIVRQAVAMFDALEILISNAAVYPAHLQARALFEASLYLQWILKDDATLKAKHYGIITFFGVCFGVWRGLIYVSSLSSVPDEFGSIPSSVQKSHRVSLSYWGYSVLDAFGM